LYNNPNTIAKDSRLKKGGQLLGHKDLLAIAGLAPAWRRWGAYKMQLPCTGEQQNLVLFFLFH